MGHTRILIFGLQQMMREIIENAVAGQSDLEIVGAAEREPLAGAVETSRADAVITAEDDPSLALALLRKHPGLTLLAVADDGRETLLYELRPRREMLGELSASALVGALRRARDYRPGWLA